MRVVNFERKETVSNYLHYEMSLSSKLYGLDEEIVSKKYNCRINFLTKAENFDSQTDFSMGEFLGKYFRRYWNTKVLLNPADQNAIPICLARDADFRAMVAVYRKNYCEPTIQNILFELFYCIEVITKSCGHALIECLLESDGICVGISSITKERALVYDKSILAQYVTSYTKSEITRQKILAQDS